MTVASPAHTPLSFGALAIALSWIPWWVVVVTVGDPTATTAATVLWALGGLGPAAAAFIVAGATRGRKGLRQITDRLRRWRLGGWYLLLLAPLPVAVLAVLAAVAFGPAALEPAAPVAWLAVPVLFVGGVVFGGLEEIGWRGYLLPRLQERWTALAASVIIGLVWALWHLPLFFMDNTSQSTASVPWFTLQAIALSIILTWAYNSTRGSLLLAVLAHAALNTWYGAAVQFLAPDAAASFMPYAAILLTAAAVALVWRHGPRDLARQPRHVWSEHSSTG